MLLRGEGVANDELINQWHIMGRDNLIRDHKELNVVSKGVSYLLHIQLEPGYEMTENLSLIHI